MLPQQTRRIGSSLANVLRQMLGAGRVHLSPPRGDVPVVGELEPASISMML